MNTRILHLGASPEQQVEANAISELVTSYEASEKQPETIVLEFPYFYRDQTFITKIVLDVPTALKIAAKIALAASGKGL